MTTFDDRERAFEAKFAHDAEMQFRAEARRSRLLGLWAAECLGKSAPEATAYAAEVVKADFARAGHEEVITKILADLGAGVTEPEVRAKFNALMPVAKAQLVGEA